MMFLIEDYKKLEWNILKIQKILNNLKEGYVTTLKSAWKDGVVEIFINPSREEILNSLGEYKEVRFIVDRRNNSVYIWEAGSLMHSDVSKKVDEVPNNYLKALIGTADYKNGSLKIKRFGEEININRVEEFVDGEYDWLENYYFEIEETKVNLANFLDEY